MRKIYLFLFIFALFLFITGVNQVQAQTTYESNAYPSQTECKNSETGTKEAGYIIIEPCSLSASGWNFFWKNKDTGKISLYLYHQSEKDCKDSEEEVKRDGHQIIQHCFYSEVYKYKYQEPSTQQNGVCGSLNGGSFTSAPTTNLCASGTPTTVSGSDPWTRQCKALEGGIMDSPICTANYSSATTTCIAPQILDQTTNTCVTPLSPTTAPPTSTSPSPSSDLGKLENPINVDTIQDFIKKNSGHCSYYRYSNCGLSDNLFRISFCKSQRKFGRAGQSQNNISLYDYRGGNFTWFLGLGTGDSRNGNRIKGMIINNI